MVDVPVLNKPAPQTIDLLLSRRSGSAKAMTGPGPNPEELRVILQAGARVPDHKKLFPWRFILFEGDGRKRMGNLLGDILCAEGDVSDERVSLERQRFMRAPVVIAKGVDVLAQQIRLVASSHRIPLVEAPPLARALYATTDIGREVPASLYVAVAQVLAYVYQVKQAVTHGMTPPEPPRPEVDPDLMGPYRDN